MSTSTPSSHPTTSRMPTEPPATSPLAPALPPPGLLDVSPHVYAILSRVLPLQPVDNLTGAPEPDGTEHIQPLEIQHLATEAAATKVRIEKARQSLKSLPDIDRTIEEQEEEIEYFESEVKRLREVLNNMTKDTDTQMGG